MLSTNRRLHGNPKLSLGEGLQEDEVMRDIFSHGRMMRSKRTVNRGNGMR
jgi:hypothetical protein